MMHFRRDLSRNWLQRRLYLSLLIVLCTGFSAACLTTTGTMQTAPTVGKGNIRLAAGTSLPVSTRFIEEFSDAIADSGDRLEQASDARPLSDDEQSDAISSALGVLLFQPSPLFIIDGRYGASEKIDIGIKLAGPAARLDGKYWLYHSSKLDAAVSLGYTRHSDIGSSSLESAYKLFKFLKLVEYKRKDLDIAILLSSDSKSTVSVYGAIRYIAAFVDLETDFEDVPTENELPGSTKSTMHHMGGTTGLRLKLGPVRLLAEMTVMKLQFQPTILGKKTDLGGYLIEPLLGLAIAF